MRPTPSRAGSIDRLRRSELSVLAAGLFAIVGVLAMRVHGTRLPLRVDRVADGFVGTTQSPRRVGSVPATVEPAALLRFLVGKGTIAIVVCLAVTMAVAAWRRRDRWAALLSLASPVLAVVLVDHAAKPLVGRSIGSALAFPSGHATATAAAATVVLVLCNRWSGWRRALRWIPVVAVVPLAVGFGMVRLGYHYPTDIVGGIAFGSGVVLALAAAIPARLPEPDATLSAPR